MDGAEAILQAVAARYTPWHGFDTAAFEAQVTQPWRDTAALARRLLGRTAMQKRLQTDLPGLWTDFGRLAHRHLAAEDTRVLRQPDVDRTEFATQMWHLLYERRPSPDKLYDFWAYADHCGWPMGWRWPTYFLLIVRPHAEMMVEPAVAQWFLTRMGLPEVYEARPSADMYERYKKAAHGLKAELAAHDPTDMIDIHGAILVAHEEANPHLDTPHI